MKKTLIYASCFWMGLMFSQALEAGAEQTDYSAGQKGNAFLNIGIGTRAVGMGEAFTGIADDISSLCWNPAGLSKVRNFQALLMHNQWFQDVIHQYGALGFPLPQGTLAASLSYVNYGTMERINEFGQVEGEFVIRDAAISLGYGIELFKNFAAGIGIKTPLCYDDENRLNLSLAGDVGLLYGIPALGGLNIGIALINAGEKKQPSRLKVGLGLVNAAEGLKIGCEIGRDLDLKKGFYTEEVDLNVGVEYRIAGILAPRLGYKYSTEEKGLGTSEVAGLTAGVGLRLAVSGMALHLDYAYVPYGDIGATHRMGMLLELGTGRGYADRVEKTRAPVKKARRRPAVRQKASLVSPPGALKVKRTGRKAKLRWAGSASAGSFGYNVYMKRGKKGKYVRVNSEVIIGNGYIVNKLSKKWNYYFMVKTVDRRGRESRGAVVRKSAKKRYAKQKSSVLQPPRRVRVKRIGRRVKLRWASSRSAKRYGYNLYMKKGKRGKYVKLNSKVIKSNSYVTRKLSKKRAYYFKLKTVDRRGRKSRGTKLKRVYIK